MNHKKIRIKVLHTHTHTYIYIYIKIYHYDQKVALIVLNPFVIYWPLTEPSIKRCTCVNKWKNSGSRWALNNNITRAQTAWVSWRQDASGVRTSSRQRAWALSDPRLSSPARMRNKCCYGQKNFGSIYQSVPVSTHNQHHPFKNKVWAIIFL